MYLGDQMPKLIIDLWIDLQAANVLFTLDCDLSSGMMMEPEFSHVNWLPGVAVDNSAPRYLMSSQRPGGMVDNAAFSTLIVKIGDMGGGLDPFGDARPRECGLLTITIVTWNAQDDFLPVTPVALRAPELVQPHSWNEKADVWALACLIFQLATNEPLFPVESFGCIIDGVHVILRSLMHEIFEHGKEKFAVHISEITD
ncbi:unnamed protein product [Penicillium egyptiacum]|uniref:Protein kinase domain-containing protein n=1 Tax=Penicillium egyptiacum TaxID=1303716 RepID=A0A9W4P1M8_9EURO|nr:unnamed protein product [Penicillium egyptiacum]